MSTILTADPLNIDGFEIDDNLPLAFADKIEEWFREEYGYSYGELVVKSAGARAESRKRLEMLGIPDPADLVRPEIHVEVDISPTEAAITDTIDIAEFVDETSAPGDETSVVFTEGDDLLPYATVVEGEAITVDDFAPAPDENLPGQQAREGLSDNQRRHEALVRAAEKGARTGRYVAPKPDPEPRSFGWRVLTAASRISKLLNGG